MFLITCVALYSVEELKTLLQSLRAKIVKSIAVLLFILLHVCTDQCTVVVGADTPTWTKAFFWCTHTHAGSCIGMYMDFAITTFLRTVKGYAIVPTA